MLRHRIPGWALFAGAAAITLLDAGILVADDTRTRTQAESPVPAVVPSTADLTRPMTARAAIGPVNVGIAQRPDGRWVLSAYNDGTHPQRIALRVECVQMMGSPMGRMGPMPQIVGQETLALSVPARGRAEHLLARPRSTGAAGGVGSLEGRIALGRSFGATEWRITDLGAHGAQAQTTVLRVAALAPTPAL